jgi:apolipoprotein D and lipocalin family protein
MKAKIASRARRLHVSLLSLLLVALSGCQGMSQPPLATVEYVDLNRFMGDWYVIASIPTRFEVGAHNAVENYRLDSDGSIPTTFSFRDGAFDGKAKTYTSRAFVTDTKTNATWGVQFIWPFRADYRIIELSPDYQTVIIARSRRDYAWVMARTPKIDAAEYDRLLERLAEVGYDTSQVQKVPQQW